jgi:DeoR/GlpR family transcriptional regulator of sugar metabolism
MGPAERRQRILDAVRVGQASVQVLSERFRVSPSTIRRDLERLGATGEVIRSYGGAVGGVRRIERSLQERELRHQAEKEAIAEEAQALVADGDVVVLDAGSTIGRLAARLRHRDDLKVITNSLNSINNLAGAPGVSVVVLGGELRSINEATLGSMTEANLRLLRADRVFLSGTAVHPELGLAAPTMAHAYLKSLMAERAAEIVVLADSSKLGADPPQFWTALDRPWTLITDARATAPVLRRFETASGATVTVAPGDAGGDC